MSKRSFAEMEKPKSNELKVITLNVWRDYPFDDLDPNLNAESKMSKRYQPWGDESTTPRKNVLLSFFDTYGQENVDIFGLQECTQSMLISGIGEHLKDYAAPFSCSAQIQEQIFYRQDRFTVIDKLAQNWPGTTNSFSMLKLRMISAQKDVIVVNTHLNWQGHGKWTSDSGPGPNTRAQQMIDIADAVIKMQNAEEVPIIVMGDLNDIYAPLKVAYDLLQVKPSFVQLSPPVVCPHTCPTPCGDAGEEVDSWAAKTYDYILSKDLKVSETHRIEYNVDGIYPSDHYPVYALYKI